MNFQVDKQIIQTNIGILMNDFTSDKKTHLLPMKELLSSRPKDRLASFQIDLEQSLENHPSHNQIPSKKKQANPVPQTIFMMAPSDWGTVLNNGRKGSMFAPKVIESLLKKMAGHTKKNKSYAIVNVTDLEIEKENFDVAQTLEKENIRHLLEKYSNSFFVHIGGGHDHIYPFFLATQSQLKENE